MVATERLRNEQRFHDRQARDRAVTFVRFPERLCFADADYLNHESWVRPAFARLGDVRGRRVLDYGCGHGMAAVAFARHGAITTACDLSAGYVAEASSRARANSVKVQCIQADAHQLPFATGGFDAVWGHAILHHLDVPVAAAELRRVLRSGGTAVLCEPWGGNPLLRLARRWLPYTGKGHTPDEEPLNRAQIKQLSAFFKHVQVEGFQLLGMVRRGLPNGLFNQILDRGDCSLLQRFPRLYHFCRYVVLTLTG